MAQKTVLGKGLASLLPTASPGAVPAPSGEVSNRERHLGISMAALEDIHVNPFQPRREFEESALEELAQSIRGNGIIQPLVVRKGSKEGFELIAGERRLRAAKLAGLKQVPIVIRRSTDKESLELALIENIQRQNLNCIDEALAYFQLLQDFSMTQEEVAERVGKDRATVANFLRLLRLPEEIIEDLKKQVLTLGHGKALLSLDDAEMRLRARAQILAKQLSVRETEALVEQMKQLKEASAQVQEAETALSAAQQRLDELSKELGRHYSTRVEVKGTENRGKIVIHYANRQDLDRILEGMHWSK